jgi:uncharacterized membrane protein YfcA
MPLSEHEQKLLNQMEQALITEDPRFASTFRGSIKNVNLKSGRTANIGVVVLGIIFGFVSLIAGVSMSKPVIGLVGFVVVVFALSSIFSSKSDGQKVPQNQQVKNRKSFMQGLEDRWDDRHQN